MLISDCGKMGSSYHRICEEAESINETSFKFFGEMKWGSGKRFPLFSCLQTISKFFVTNIVAQVYIFYFINLKKTIHTIFVLLGRTKRRRVELHRDIIISKPRNVQI